MNRSDQKITLCKIKFNLGACKDLTKKEVDSLSDTARNFFYFIQAFGLKLKLRSFVNICMFEDRVQDLDSATCGIFQIYFYDNLSIYRQKQQNPKRNKVKKKYCGNVIK